MFSHCNNLHLTSISFILCPNSTNSPSVNASVEYCRTYSLFSINCLIFSSTSLSPIVSAMRSFIISMATTKKFSWGPWVMRVSILAISLYQMTNSIMWIVIFGDCFPDRGNINDIEHRCLAMNWPPLFRTPLDYFHFCEWDHFFINMDFFSNQINI